MEMPRPSAMVISRKAATRCTPARSPSPRRRDLRCMRNTCLRMRRADRLPLPAAVRGLARNTQEVAAVLRICHEMGVPVVPRGSGTSLAGGALPTADCVILGVAQMNDVIETNYDDRYIRVQTGAPTCPSRAPSKPTGSSMRPTRPASWPAPSRAISR